VTWGKVSVKLKNHSAGGIANKDFALARSIEEVVLWHPEAGSPLGGAVLQFRYSHDVPQVCSVSFMNSTQSSSARSPNVSQT
jgi:hypothetical protein